MRAGFAETDITPPAGTKKIGWMVDLAAEQFLGPLFARTAAFDDGTTKIGFIQLDTLCVRWTHTSEIRRRIEQETGFPGRNIMVSASHNHAGPAVANCDPVKRDEDYAEQLVRKCVAAFAAAIGSMQAVRMGYGRSLNFDVAHNRRTMMRDGTVRSQTPSSNADYLCLEGPIDPEVAVLAVASAEEKLIGAMVNYACHPTHHGGTNEICAGFPGIVCARMKQAGCPVTLYLNGAYGNVIAHDFERCRALSMEESGESIFHSVQAALGKMNLSSEWTAGAMSETIRLPFREITDDEYHGRVRGAQRYRSDELYEGAIDGLRKRIEREEMQPAEVQVLRMNDVCLVGIPAEYFVEHQLRIKTATYPKKSLVVGGANGMIGYVPTKAAFPHGGYETTLGPPSRMAPETGDLLADKAIELISRGT
jgi:neutral ceramidase